MRAAWLGALVFACHHPPPPAPEEPLPPDVPVHPEGGPIAGPHYVVEAPPAPAVPADVPGQGLLPPYLSLLRRDLADRMKACTQATSGGNASLQLVLAPDGTPTTAKVTRSSGDEGWDGCLVASVNRGAFEAPPASLLEGGAFATVLVFR